MKKIDASQEQQIRTWLHNKAIRRSCAGCGSGLNVKAGYKNLALLSISGTGDDRMVTLTCPECGCVQYFSASVMGLGDELR